MRHALLLAGLCLALLAPAGAQAGDCGYRDCWGAVGIGPGGAYGWSFGMPSEKRAIRVVRRECGGNCTVIRAFYNTCGAMAQAPNGAWGFGWHQDPGVARRLARKYCAERAKGCRVRVWACSK